MVKDFAKHWLWGGYILRQQWQCTQLTCLFSFCSSRMVDGVMILPVLIMMVFPSPSWQGEWCAGWRSSCLLLEEPGSAAGAAWQRSTAPCSLQADSMGKFLRGMRCLLFHFKLLQRIFVARLCIKFIACAIGIDHARAWEGKWETLFEWLVTELWNE